MHSKAEVPPCASCHGPDAKGADAFSSSGQLHDYMFRNSTNWDKERGQGQAGHTSAIMLAHHLTEAQIRAVAAYSGMTTCSPPRPDKAIVLRQIEARRGETIQEGDGIDYLKKTGQRIMTKSGGISRRQILTIAGAAGVSLTGAAAVIGTSTSAQAAKVSQKLVKYQDTPKGEQRCDNCELFEAPSSCKNVDGTIAAQGWCTVYRKKPA